MMIELHELSRHFGAKGRNRAGPVDTLVRAVDGVSLTVASGTTTVIRGPSGSGKTTLLRLIAGLERPDGGEIAIGRETVSTPAWVLPPHERKVGFVFQEPALWPHLTVAQNVAFGLLGRPKAEIRERVAEALESMDLAGLQKRYPAQLSGGQARRVALARTLAVDPEILLLDEPLTHLQPELKAQLLAIIGAQVAARSMTLITVTHNLDEAAQWGGRQLTMVDGKIADLGGGQTDAA